MRLHLISDLHLEYAPFELPDVEADVAVFAGDIAPGARGLRWLDALADGRPKVYVPGNHEFYGEALPALNDSLRSQAGGDVHFLENDEVVIDGVRFLGCSLWSDFQLAGPENVQRSMATCERVVNDYKHVSSSRTGGRLRAAETLQLHQLSRAWLERKLREAHPGPTVVVTHHAPLVRTPPRNPVLAAVGASFASDLSSLMGPAVDLWVFGHVHRCLDTVVDGTRVISNQRGYPHEPVADFNPELVVEI